MDKPDAWERAKTYQRFHQNIWIIEHPTRGVLKFFVSSEEFGFSTHGMRGDPDNCELFYSHEHAIRVLHKLPDNVKYRCRIRYNRANWDIVG